MSPVAPQFDPVTNPAISSLSSEEKQIYAAIEDEETAMEHVIERTGLPSATVSSTLMRLQIKRLVKQLPGQYFVKLV
jgi:DNA processing protein